MKITRRQLRQLIVESMSQDEMWEKVSVLIEAGAVEDAVYFIEMFNLKAQLNPMHPIYGVIRDSKLGSGEKYRLLMAVTPVDNRSTPWRN